MVCCRMVQIDDILSSELLARNLGFWLTLFCRWQWSWWWSWLTISYCWNRSQTTSVQLNPIRIKSVTLQNPQWPKQQRCKMSNSLKVWSKPHAFIQSTTNLAYCFLNDRGLTICAASLAPQCSPILVNPWWWWTCTWLYELLFQEVPFQVSVDYIADQHSSNCCYQIQASFYFFCNHFCWTDATSSACPWSLEECRRVSPSAETLITHQHLLYGCHFTF